MNLIRTAAVSFGILAVTGIFSSCVSATHHEPGMVFASADQAQFKELAPGASMAVISGDPDKGAHRVFTKFVPGATFPLHIHTSAMHIVVIKGAYIYRPEKGAEKRVGPGCYIDIPGGDRHASGGDAKEGALFYEESAGKFDLAPVEKEKK